MPVRVIQSCLMKNLAGILFGIAWNLHINLGEMASLSYYYYKIFICPFI
jgi:hypothetical protein